MAADNEKPKGRDRSNERIPFNDHWVTPREWEVIFHSINNSNSLEVATTLSISIGTLYNHRRTIFQRFGLNNWIEFVIMASKQGLPYPPEVEKQ